MDLAEQILDTWRINARVNRFFLDELTEDQLRAPLAKGKSVSGQFSHIHNVRLMWLKASAPDLHAPLAKIEPEASKQEIADALDASAVAIEELIRRGLGEGKVKNFRPHTAAFVGYMVSHESFHRAHAELALRQAGIPLPDKVAYGAWEWGVR